MSTIYTYPTTLNGQSVDVGTIGTYVLERNDDSGTYIGKVDRKKLPNETYYKDMVIVPFVHVI